MLSRLLKRVHILIFGFLPIFSDLFSILIVLSVQTVRSTDPSHLTSVLPSSNIDHMTY